MSSLLSPFGISWRVSASQIKYSSRLFLSATRISYYCLLTTPQLLRLIPIGTHFSYFYQLPFPTPISYSYQLLVTGSCSCPLLYQLLHTVSATVISATIFRHSYQATLSHIFISYSHQAFISDTFISYLYLLYSHTPKRCSCRNSFVTNHHQLQYHVLLRSSRSQRFFKIGVLKNLTILTGKHLCWCLVLIKLHGLRPATLLKRDSNIDVFLWVLRNF